MRAIIQRVSAAMLVSEGTEIAKIGRGIVAMIGVEREDDEQNVTRMAERLLSYRIFPDDAGRMNRSLADIGGELLLVPNFTVAADTAKGTRAGFSTTADPESGKRLFEQLAGDLRHSQCALATGIFAADMQITLTNDGPVTFIISS